MHNQGELIEKTLKIVGGKWKVLILWTLSQHKTARFGELKARIPGISQRVLTLQLRNLEEHGLVLRRVFPEIPPRVEYSLTSKAEGLETLYSAICTWGKKHFKAQDC